MTQYLTIWDLVLTPLYLVILRYIAQRTMDRRYPIGHPLRQYYLPGMYVKFAGAIFIALVYQFYYGGGDTYNFFYHSKIINSAFTDSLSTWFNLMRRVPVDEDPTLYKYVAPMYWYEDPPSYMVAVIAALFGLLNGTTYIPIALMFAYLSYTGIWAMFRIFAGLYPAYHKSLAIAFFFIPSTFVWGSAVFKDTVCMFGLGWLTYTTFRMFVHKDFTFRNIFLLVLSFYLIAVIKVYILLAFIPALGLWLLLTYSRKIKSVSVRWATNIISVLMIIGAFLFFSQKFSAELDKYSIERLAETATITKDWIAYVSDIQEGSGYDLGDFDPTIGGMLSKFPAAVNVALFRPYIWEARKPIVILSALEAMAFLGFTIWVFYKGGVGKTFKKISRDPNLLFFLMFTLIFAFAVGISTYNFGTLSRYKIPCMPFFAAALLLLNSQRKALLKNANKQQRKVRHFA